MAMDFMFNKGLHMSGTILRLRGSYSAPVTLLLNAISVISFKVFTLYLPFSEQWSIKELSFLQDIQFRYFYAADILSNLTLVDLGVYSELWITYRELDDLVEHDMRRDVEVKDEILQREEKKAGPLKFIQIYLKWIRHSPFRFALGEKMCHGDCY